MTEAEDDLDCIFGKRCHSSAKGEKIPLPQICNSVSNINHRSSIKQVHDTTF